MNAPVSPRALRKRKPSPLKQTAELRAALHGMGDVRDPGEAEEPILSPAVRKALLGWIYEINNAGLLEDVGLKPRSTALLFGPPGCGKTTMAHHLAARMGVPLVCVGSENIFAPYLGEAEKNVARLFDAIARCETPCVVLLDEIDAIGSKRASDPGGGAQNARNSTLNVLLRRIEDYRGILIGATNLMEKLDTALWRRFGMQISVDLPGDDERFAILRRYGEPFEFGDDAIEALTDLTAAAAPSLLRQLMEGVKRLLVIGDKLGHPPTDPVATFSAVLAQIKPHPDLVAPPLWADKHRIREIADMPWPPSRIGEGS